MKYSHSPHLSPQQYQPQQTLYQPQTLYQQQLYQQQPYQQQPYQQQTLAFGTVLNRIKILHLGVQLVPQLILETTITIGTDIIPARYYLFLQSTTISDPQAVVTLLDQTSTNGYINMEVGGLSTAGVSIYVDDILRYTLPALTQTTPEPTLPRNPPYYDFETGAIGYFTYQIV